MDRVMDDREAGHEIYPEDGMILNSLTHAPIEDIKAIIIGQDPYHGPGQAHGLSFSVPPLVSVPPSLNNIFRELHSDIRGFGYRDGYLVPWASQGVLLLNTTLTVRKGEPGSHAKFGWDEVTRNIIRGVVRVRSEFGGVVVMAWGQHAQRSWNAVAERCFPQELDKVLVLRAAHPSPYSANNGFFGCKHFSKANKWLEENDQEPIQWSLE